VQDASSAVELPLPSSTSSAATSYHTAGTLCKNRRLYPRVDNTLVTHKFALSNSLDTVIVEVTSGEGFGTELIPRPHRYRPSWLGDSAKAK